MKTVSIEAGDGTVKDFVIHKMSDYAARQFVLINSRGIPEYSESERAMLLSMRSVATKTRGGRLLRLVSKKKAL